MAALYLKEDCPKALVFSEVEKVLREQGIKIHDVELIQIGEQLFRLKEPGSTNQVFELPRVFDSIRLELIKGDGT